MGSPYVVGVARLLREVPSSIEVAFSAPFDEGQEFTPRAPVETDVFPEATVEVSVRIESFSGGLRVRGRIEAPWHGVCRRCSTPVLGRSVASVDERFVEHREPGDEESYLIEHDAIDLAPLVHDAILLELPLAPLCREDCQGLCPICGVDRNETSCTCEAPTDPRWATLDGLRFAESEPEE